MHRPFCLRQPELARRVWQLRLSTLGRNSPPKASLTHQSPVEPPKALTAEESCEPGALWPEPARPSPLPSETRPRPDGQPNPFPPSLPVRVRSRPMPCDSRPQLPFHPLSLASSALPDVSGVRQTNHPGQTGFPPGRRVPNLCLPWLPFLERFQEHRGKASRHLPALPSPAGGRRD